LVVALLEAVADTALAVIVTVRINADDIEAVDMASREAPVASVSDHTDMQKKI